MRAVRQSGSMRCVLAGLLVVGISAPMVIPTQANPSGNLRFADFEIDGNFYEGFDNDTTATGPDGVPVDWGSDDIYPAEVDVVDDPLGGVDPTIYDRGAKEDDLESWDDAGSAAPPSKSDVGAMYIHDRIFEGDQYVFLGFERPSDAGSTAWYIELNQLPNTTNANGTTVPDRSVDDIRMFLINRGDGEFVVERIDTWDGDSWVDAGFVEIARAVNRGTVPVQTPAGQLGTDQFGEFGFRLADVLPDQDACDSRGFATLNLRSLAGPSEQSELKDYATGEIDIPSRCGALRIEKRDPAGELLGGASFTITPDPTPGSGAASLDVADNDANDADPTDGVIVIDPAQPGEYTITEATPPPGYISTTEPQDVTLDAYGSATVVFENGLGSLTWEKRDETSDILICCATFTVVATDGAAAAPPWEIDLTVYDNDGVHDTDPAIGVITVESLPTGTYTVTETVPPTGYDLPDDPAREGIEISADTPDVVIENDLVDPRLLTELSVLKLDADTEEPLAGAVFELYLDDGDGEAQAPDGDTLVGDCTTGGDGTCTVDGLGWGTYYWYEVSAPAGYDLPADRTSDMILIDRTNAGAEITAAEFRDPQIRSSIEIVKRDAKTEEPLGGATFVLRRGSADGEIVDPPGEFTTDASGSYTIDGLPFGTYWVEEIAAPDGYDLPEEPVSGPHEFGSENAGETITVTFDDPQIRTDLSVLKVDGGDQGSPLPGAVFELYLDDGDGVGDAPDDGDELVDECTTDEDGLCTITGLGFGDYFWYEVSAPEGYDLPADRTSPIIVVNAANAGDEPTPYTFTNPRVPGALTVEKLDESDDAALAGATFDLVLDNGDGVYEPGVDDVVGTCTTSEDGTCTIEDLDFGTYFWVETEAPAGYDLPEVVVSDPVEIDAGNVRGEVQLSTFHDPRLPSELTVVKVDAVDGTPLAGAEFDLVLDDGDGSYDSEADTVVDGCSTGADGTCTIGGLDFGTYFWVETAAPAGYTLPETVVSAPIVIGASNAGGDITATVYEDPRVLSELTVRKLDEHDDEPLAGALFSLLLDDGDGVYGDGDTFHASCLTGADGTCTVDGVDFGTYFWVETQAPTGYELPDEPVSGPIVVSPDTAGGEFAVVTFHDPRILTELAVKKVAEDTGEVLAGGVFELYLDDGDGVGDAPDDGDELIGECTTGEDGLCSIAGLGFGDYYWYETKAPEGYVVPADATSDIATIDASNAGQTMTYIFVDPPEGKVTPPPEQPEGPKLPITGAGLVGLLAAVAGGLVLAGGGLMLVRRRRSMTA